MLTPARAGRRRKDSGGEKLAQPWQSAEDAGAFFRRGQLSMVVAGAGVGKSVLMLAYAVYSDEPVLYLSMDADAFTTSVRLTAAVSGKTIGEAESAISAGEQWPRDELGKIANLTLAFPNNPDATEIGHRLQAYRELRGRYPSAVVVDNLQNITAGDDGYSGQTALLRDLEVVARRTGSAIIVLHHAVGEYDNGDAPLPQSGIRNKLSQFPSLILTMYRAQDNLVGVSVVKNRFGPADPSGVGSRFFLVTDMSRASFSDDTAADDPFPGDNTNGDDPFSDTMSYREHGYYE